MNIYVGNLAFDVTEDELKEAFAPFGEVTEVRLIMDKYSGKSKGFAFIEMPSKEEAEKAIEEMNGKEMNGRAIAVNIAKPKVDRSSGGRRGGFSGGQRRDGRGRGGGFGNRRDRDRKGGSGKSRGGGSRGRY